MRKGFTLIELLVVIAIIAILAAILFPVFGKAREKARQTHCTNNQKQFATALQIYTQEHEELLPAFTTFWGDIRVDKAALKCLSKPSLDNGYGYNAAIAGKGLGQIRYLNGHPNAGQIAEASEVFVTCDSKRSYTDVAFNEPNIVFFKQDLDPRHNGKLVAAFLDGHVDMVLADSTNAADITLATTYSIPPLEDYAPSSFENNTAGSPEDVNQGDARTFSMSSPCLWQVQVVAGVTDVVAADVTLDPAAGTATNEVEATFTKGSAVAGAHFRITATPTKAGAPAVTRYFRVPGTQIFTLNPTADASVRDGAYSNTNGAYANGLYGNTTPKVAIRNQGGDIRVYMKFTIPAASGPVTSATLKFYFEGGDLSSGNPFIIQARNCSNTTWSETVIAGNSTPAAPTYDATDLGTVSITTHLIAQYTITLDPTYVQGKMGSTITLVLRQSSQNSSWSNIPWIYSREDTTGKAPVLTIQVN